MNFAKAGKFWVKAAPLTPRIVLIRLRVLELCRAAREYQSILNSANKKGRNKRKGEVETQILQSLTEQRQKLEDSIVEWDVEGIPLMYSEDVLDAYQLPSHRKWADFPVRCNKPVSAKGLSGHSSYKYQASLYDRITGGAHPVLSDSPASTIAAADLFQCVATLFYIVGTKVLKWPNAIHKTYDLTPLNEEGEEEEEFAE